MAASFGYLPEWPAGPPASSVPDWAHPGRIRFSRWDGGPIETAKAMLSGWAGFNPPIPDYLLRDDQLVSALDDRGCCARREHQFDLGDVLPTAFPSPPRSGSARCSASTSTQCHRQGIHVMAYESVANLFWEDMYEHVPESKHWVSIGTDGKPVPYGAARLRQDGTRHPLHGRSGQPAVARLPEAADRPGHRRRGRRHHVRQLRYSLQLADVFQDIMRYALSRKKDFLIMANFHRHDFILNRLLNAITTEEGRRGGHLLRERTLAGGTAIAGRASADHHAARRGRLPGQQHRPVPHLREPLRRLEAGDDREPRPRGGHRGNARHERRSGTSS